MDSFEASDCPEPCMAPVSVPNHRVRRNAVQVPASHPQPLPAGEGSSRHQRARSTVPSPTKDVDFCAISVPEDLPLARARELTS